MTTSKGHAARLAQALSVVLGTEEIPLRLRAWDGSEAGPEGAPVLEFHSRRALRRILWSPGQLGLSRAYVAGDIDSPGDIFAAFTALSSAGKFAEPGPFQRPTAGEMWTLLRAAVRRGARFAPPPPPPPPAPAPPAPGAAPPPHAARAQADATAPAADAATDQAAAAADNAGDALVNAADATADAAGAAATQIGNEAAAVGHEASAEVKEESQQAAEAADAAAEAAAAEMDDDANPKK